MDQGGLDPACPPMGPLWQREGADSLLRARTVAERAPAEHLLCACLLWGLGVEGSEPALLLATPSSGSLWTPPSLSRSPLAQATPLHRAPKVAHEMGPDPEARAKGCVSAVPAFGWLWPLDLLPSGSCPSSAWRQVREGWQGNAAAGLAAPLFSEPGQRVCVPRGTPQTVLGGWVSVQSNDQLVLAGVLA